MRHCSLQSRRRTSKLIITACRISEFGDYNNQMPPSLRGHGLSDGQHLSHPGICTTYTQKLLQASAAFFFDSLRCGFILYLTHRWAPLFSVLQLLSSIRALALLGSPLPARRQWCSGMSLYVPVLLLLQLPASRLSAIGTACLLRLLLGLCLAAFVQFPCRAGPSLSKRANWMVGPVGPPTSC